MRPADAAQLPALLLPATLLPALLLPGALLLTLALSAALLIAGPARAEETRAPQPVAARPVLQGDATLPAEDVARARQALLDSGQAETPDGQYRLALLLRSGPDSGQDALRAVRLLQSAAAGGHAQAQVELGELALAVHQPGYAAEQFQAAAAQGHPAAQERLGDLYGQGQGLEASPNAAQYWYFKAAGTHLAQGVVLPVGRIVRRMRDLDPAHPYLRRLADALVTAAAQRLAEGETAQALRLLDLLAQAHPDDVRLSGLLNQAAPPE